MRPQYLKRFYLHSGYISLCLFVMTYLLGNSVECSSSFLFPLMVEYSKLEPTDSAIILTFILPSISNEVFIYPSQFLQHVSILYFFAKRVQLLSDLPSCVPLPLLKYLRRRSIPKFKGLYDTLCYSQSLYTLFDSKVLFNLCSEGYCMLVALVL